MSTPESRREYYAKNKAAVLERTMRWQLKNPEIVKFHKTNSRKNARASKPYMQSIYQAKARAIKHSIDFDLTEEWAKARWTGKCELTGAEFEVLTGGKPSAFSISLDRINPDIGYVKDNCRFILWSVNRFKSNYNDETMLHIARLLVGVH